MSQDHEGKPKKGSGFQLRKTPGDPSSEPRAADESMTASTDLDQLGDLPHSYGSDTLFLVAQEPRWLFTYWDIDISRHPGGQANLRVYREDGSLETEIEVTFESRNWYIPVNDPGATYTVEIGYYRGSTWKPIARSAAVQTPPDSMSSSEAFEYASIPLHLSFQKLSDSVHSAIRSGESLTQALSRLQKADFPGGLSEIALGQQIILEALLGRKLLDELTGSNLNPEEIDFRVRTYLEERLSSGGGSDLFSTEMLEAAGLSSFTISPLFSGEQASSWNVGALSSWASAALSSWMSIAGTGASWGIESSWGSVVGSSWGMESLTSWSQVVASSWGQSVVSSWLSAAQSSWFPSTQSSWNTAALTSWSGASSWSGGSETLNSFGVTREFFMHVNAEVIFYGGTDPRAKVTIDGKPIKLNHDGSFRYHFIFPDGKYEIPIVAVSPDGVETRSAILRFDRNTHKFGGVDATAQPPLDAPMGATGS